MKKQTTDCMLEKKDYLARLYTRGAGLGWRCPCVNAGELIPYLTRN